MNPAKKAFGVKRNSVKNESPFRNKMVIAKETSAPMRMVFNSKVPLSIIQSNSRVRNKTSQSCTLLFNLLLEIIFNSKNFKRNAMVN